MKTTENIILFKKVYYYPPSLDSWPEYVMSYKHNIYVIPDEINLFRIKYMGYQYHRKIKKSYYNKEGRYYYESIYKWDYDINWFIEIIPDELKTTAKYYS